MVVPTCNWYNLDFMAGTWFSPSFLMPDTMEAIKEEQFQEFIEAHSPMGESRGPSSGRNLCPHNHADYRTT